MVGGRATDYERTYKISPSKPADRLVAGCLRDTGLVARGSEGQAQSEGGSCVFVALKPDRGICSEERQWKPSGIDFWELRL